MAMELEQYTKAVDLCSCAIALSEDNKDVLYCNRAAAHYGNQKYAAALCDCMKAIEINPKCIEAYSHFGHIRLEQGNIIDALCHGFVKVVQLDPSNEEAQENIRVCSFLPFSSHLSFTKSEFPQFLTPLHFCPQICEEKLRDKFTRMREQNEALVNLIKEPFLPLVRSTRPVAPREAPSTSARPSQSGDRNTNKSPTHETIETGEVENMEEVVALLSISSSNLDDPLGSKP
ncbi:Small glutamine-rich tetratricopeptide repeat-containing protein beta [Vitis vinifera]|uniref:Small glutamine-rich tetratricopeptide repeat-containing protein beta n=1 Tax=Vitis vinifera TaxID=29760 RepID=A0A438E6V9_VITVI|nr:Small glutamine-rich tetratricopeptide repeat-containing protein beta [Vitis vinifera]